MSAGGSEERFVELVQEALAQLPPEFHRYLQGLEVRVEDYPDDGLMREWGMKPPNYPFGAYEGPSLLEAQDPRDFPGTIVLYRRPLEEWCQTEEELRDQIRRTVFHELAHRFGFPEEGMLAELRAGAGLSRLGVEPSAERQRHLVQAEHDLAAAKLLWEGGFPDWALEAALLAAHRALMALLLGKGEDPAAVEGEEMTRLLVRATQYDRRLRRFHELFRLDQVDMGMGDPGTPPPSQRVPKERALSALRLAGELLAEIQGGSHGAGGKGGGRDQTGAA